MTVIADNSSITCDDGNGTVERDTQKKVYSRRRRRAIAYVYDSISCSTNINIQGFNLLATIDSTAVKQNERSV